MLQLDEIKQEDIVEVKEEPVEEEEDDGKNTRESRQYPVWESRAELTNQYMNSLMLPSTSTQPDPPKVVELPSYGLDRSKFFIHGQEPCAYCGTWISPHMGRKVPFSSEREAWCKKLGEKFRKNIEGAPRSYEPIICGTHFPPSVRKKNGKIAVGAVPSTIEEVEAEIIELEEQLNRLKSKQKLEVRKFPVSQSQAQIPTKASSSSSSSSSSSGGDLFATHICVYCYYSVHQVHMERIVMNQERINKWEKELGYVTRYLKDKGPGEHGGFICKSHFDADQFTGDGKLKPNAVPNPAKYHDKNNKRRNCGTAETADGEVEKLVSLHPQLCFYCCCVVDQSDMSRVAMNASRIVKWEKEIGYKLDFQVLKKSDWICNSHFEDEYFDEDGNLMLNAVPKRILSAKEKPHWTSYNYAFRSRKRERKQVAAETRISKISRVCFYCLYMHKQVKMTTVLMNHDRMNRWENECGYKPDPSILEKSSWICKSHFKPEDFLKNGVLMEYAVPKPLREFPDRGSEEKRTLYPVRPKRVQQDEDPLAWQPSCLREKKKREENIKNNHKPTYGNPSSFVEGHEPCAYCEDYMPPHMGKVVPADPKNRELWCVRLGEKFRANIESVHETYTPVICEFHFSVVNTVNGRILPGALPISIKETAMEFRELDSYDKRRKAGDHSRAGERRPEEVVAESARATRYRMYSRTDVALEHCSVGRCMYCRETVERHDLVQLHLDEGGLKHWGAMLHNTVSLKTLLLNPWVCRAHFSADAFTADGMLKPLAFPLEYTPGRKQHLYQMGNLLDAAIQIQPGELDEERKVEIFQKSSILHDHSYAMMFEMQFDG